MSECEWEEQRGRRARVGVNTLKNVVPQLSTEAGLVIHYTNHSLQATAVTRMYEKGVPEKIIADKSGHKSMKALRSCEHTSFMQEKAAGECIQHGKQYEPLVERSTTETPPALSKACSSTTGMPPVVPSTPLPQQQIPPKMAFSGLNNYTFNFYKM